MSVQPDPDAAAGGMMDRSAPVLDGNADLIDHTADSFVGLPPVKKAPAALFDAHPPDQAH